MSRRSARTIHNLSLELSPDLVLHGIRKSTFQHLTVNTSSQNGLKTFLMDPVLENKSFYFRYLHIPLSISKTEKMKTRISVSHIKSMNFPYNDQTKIVRKIYQSLGFPIKIYEFPKNEQNEKSGNTIISVFLHLS